jgi:nitrite reductase (NADH) small subunit
LVVSLVRIASTSELPPLNEAREFSAGERIVCIANVDGRFAAIDNVCPHRGGPLGGGVVLDGKVVCPWHAWQWDPFTGQAAHAEQRVAVYPLSIEGDDVLVEI